MDVGFWLCDVFAAMVRFTNVFGFSDDKSMSRREEIEPSEENGYSVLGDEGMAVVRRWKRMIRVREG